MLKKIMTFFLIAFLLILFTKFAGEKKPRYQTNIRYSSPNWLSNERIICAKYIDHYKLYYGFLANISKGTAQLFKSETQIVSMNIDGTDEKIIKNIVMLIKSFGRTTSSEKYFIGDINDIDYNPKRRLIAFRGLSGRLYLMNEDGTDLKKIAEQVGGSYFSPDGKFLQYTLNDKVWLYDLDSKERRVLNENVRGGPWSPDGKWIYYILQGDHTNNFRNHLNIVNVKTGKKFIIEDAGSVNWSPINSKFTYTISKKIEQGYASSLYISKLTDDEIVNIDSISNASGGVWNPEGDTILFRDNADNKIYSLNCNTKEKKMVFQPSPENFHLSDAYRLKKEPEVEKIYPRCWIISDRVIIESDERIYDDAKTKHSVLVVDVNTSSVVFRYILEDYISNVLLSPDGKSLLFYDGAKLKVIIENGTRVVELIKRET